MGELGQKSRLMKLFLWMQVYLLVACTPSSPSLSVRELSLAALALRVVHDQGAGILPCQISQQEALKMMMPLKARIDEAREREQDAVPDSTACLTPNLSAEEKLQCARAQAWLCEAPLLKELRAEMK